jgi:hypothetical protein
MYRNVVHIQSSLCGPCIDFIPVRAFVGYIPDWEWLRILENGDQQGRFLKEDLPCGSGESIRKLKVKYRLCTSSSYGGHQDNGYMC